VLLSVRSTFVRARAHARVCPVYVWRLINDVESGMGRVRCQPKGRSGCRPPVCVCRDPAHRHERPVVRVAGDDTHDAVAAKYAAEGRGRHRKGMRTVHCGDAGFKSESSEEDHDRE
jgi:hypothetical protein